MKSNEFILDRGPQTPHETLSNSNKLMEKFQLCRR